MVRECCIYDHPRVLHPNLTEGIIPPRRCSQISKPIKSDLKKVIWEELVGISPNNQKRKEELGRLGLIVGDLRSVPNDLSDVSPCGPPRALTASAEPYSMEPDQHGTCCTPPTPRSTPARPMGGRVRPARLNGVGCFRAYLYIYTITTSCLPQTGAC